MSQLCCLHAHQSILSHFTLWGLSYFNDLTFQGSLRTPQKLSDERMRWFSKICVGVQHSVFLKIFFFIKVIHQFKFKFLHLIVVKPRPQEIMLYSQEHLRKGIGEGYILNAKKAYQKLFYFSPLSMYF